MSEKRELAAPCGLYCGACSLYLANREGNAEEIDRILRVWELGSDTACQGCGSEVVIEYCRTCEFKDCVAKQEIDSCAECLQFPCPRLVAFNNDGIRHHAIVLDNLRRIQEIGVASWLDEQEKRWSCPSCGAAIDWYRHNCFHCGAALPKRV